VYTEGGAVIVFVSGTKPVAWFTVSWDAVDLDCLEDESIPASDMNLTVDVDRDGARYLYDPDHLPCYHRPPDSSA
jgi:hypothetical protein